MQSWCADLARSCANHPCGIWDREIRASHFGNGEFWLAHNSYDRTGGSPWVSGCALCLPNSTLGEEAPQHLHAAGRCIYGGITDAAGFLLQGFKGELLEVRIAVGGKSSEKVLEFMPAESG